MARLIAVTACVHLSTLRMRRLGNAHEAAVRPSDVSLEHRPKYNDLSFVVLSHELKNSPVVCGTISEKGRYLYVLSKPFNAIMIVHRLSTMAQQDKDLCEDLLFLQR